MTRLSAQHGFSMIAVMWVMLATGMLAGAAFALVGGDIPLARAAQDRKQALAAAEAGLEYYLYQLTRDNDYWARCADVQPPTGPVVPVNQRDPGADRKWLNVSGSEARFSIELLPANGAPTCDAATPETTMIDATTGTFRIRSTGDSRGVRRTLIATYRRASFLDYMYFTDLETIDPEAISNAAKREYAAASCVQVRASRPADCQENDIAFQGFDSINGPLHTNDDLLVCGTPTFGRRGTDAVEVVGPLPEGWKAQEGTGCGTSAPNFLGTLRQPAPHLQMPASNTALRDAALPENLFYGETTIRFDGSHTMTVTNAGSTFTRTLPSNGVVYVDKTDTCLLEPPRRQTYPSKPTCAQLTVSGTYPKSMTLGSRDDILVDADLRKGSDQAVLGLIAERFVRVKHQVAPDADTGDGDQCDLNVGTPEELHIEAAILSLQHSFVVDNWVCGPTLGKLRVDGAIAQKFRGPTGTFDRATNVRTHGYEKVYNYDDRLRYRSPPYFLDPVAASWRMIRSNEQVPAVAG